MIITRDSDFLRFHAKGFNHKGIIFIASQLSIGAIIDDIEKVFLMSGSQDLENTVIFLPLK